MALNETETDAFAAFLTNYCCYIGVRRLPNGSYACILPFMFTHAILTVEEDSFGGYSDRWCYEDLASASAALDAWDGTGEPQGWHRHPRSGRRRPEGNPGLEYIEP